MVDYLKIDPLSPKIQFLWILVSIFQTGADRLNTLIGLVQIPLEEITSRQPLEKWYVNLK